MTAVSYRKSHSEWSSSVTQAAASVIFYTTALPVTLCQWPSAVACRVPTRRIWWRWAGFWRRCCPWCTEARPGSAGLQWCRRKQGCNAAGGKKKKKNISTLYMREKKKYWFPLHLVKPSQTSAGWCWMLSSRCPPSAISRLKTWEGTEFWLRPSWATVALRLWTKGSSFKQWILHEIWK